MFLFILVIAVYLFLIRLLYVTISQLFDINIIDFLKEKFNDLNKETREIVILIPILLVLVLVNILRGGN